MRGYWYYEIKPVAAFSIKRLVLQKHQTIYIKYSLNYNKVCGTENWGRTIFNIRIYEIDTQVTRIQIRYIFLHP